MLEKNILKLSTAKQLNLKFIWDFPILFKFMEVHKNEEDQAVSLSKEDKCMLSLLHTRDTNNNKQQENTQCFNRNYHIQDKKYVQHENDNMPWDYQKFTSRPFGAKNYKLEEEILLFHNIITWLIQNLVKLFAIFVGLIVHI